MKPSGNNSQRLPPSARFLLVGGFAALIGWLVRFPLSHFLPYSAAVGVATVMGMAFSFALYRSFVFPGSARPLSRQIRDFTLINLASLVIVTAVASILVNVSILTFILGSWAEGFAHAVGIGIGAVSNFVGHRMVTFAEAADEMMLERRFITTCQTIVRWGNGNGHRWRQHW